MERKSFKWMIVDLMFMYIVTGLRLILMAFLMEKFQLNGTFVEVGVTVIYVVSGIAGGLIAGKKDEEKKKFLWGLLLGSLYFLILFAVSAALAGGLPKDLVHMGTTLGICMAAGTLGGMMS